MSERVNATVVFVDVDRMTMTCCTADGCNLFHNVAYSNLGWRGEGVETVPEIGSKVELEIVRGEATVVRNLQRRAPKGSFTQMFSGFARNVVNSVFSRPKLPGETSISAVNGAGALFTRGRSASIFSGDLAQMHLLGIVNTIKAVASNFDVIGSGLRVESKNKDGRVLTRLCFTPDPANLAIKLKDDADGVAANCEFQIDFDGPNMNVFVRGRDKAGDLANKVIASFNSEGGEVIVRCGDDIASKGMSSEFRMGDGFVRETVFADRNDSGVAPIVYRRVVAKTIGGDKVRVTERIIGNVDREIDGDLNEVIRGRRITNADEIETNAVSVDEFINSKTSFTGRNDINPLTKPMKPLGGGDGR